jgi:hypothetical protein
MPPVMRNQPSSRGIEEDLPTISFTAYRWPALLRTSSSLGMRTSWFGVRFRRGRPSA